MITGKPYCERELALPTAQLRIQELEWREPVDDVVVLDGGRHYFDMCLTPRPKEACGSYVGRFRPSEYEPLGRVIFIPTGLPVHLRAGLGRQWALQCWFSAEFFEGLPAIWDRQRLRESLHVSHPGLKAACDRIVAELSEPGFASAIVVESLCAVIAVDLARHLSAVRPIPSGGLPGWRLRRIEERVRAEGAPPTLSELAALCGMSPRHLTRAFRQQTGRTLSDLVAEVRMSRAMALLASDDLSLKEVGDRLGFAHPSAFSAAFRRATGERPSDYRARMQTERRWAVLSGSRKRVS
jgi:AraC family transcriptional regulator